jgi:hypothetical protein
MGSDYFNDLNDVKIDINMNLKLGIENILKKDYKTYYLLEQGNKGIGISSIVVPMELLFSTFSCEAISKSIENQMESMKLGLFGIMTSYKDKDKLFKRELLFYSNDKIFSRENSNIMVLIKEIEEDEGFKLHSKQMENKENEKIMV